VCMCVRACVCRACVCVCACVAAKHTPTLNSARRNSQAAKLQSTPYTLSPSKPPLLERTACELWAAAGPTCLLIGAEAIQHDSCEQASHHHRVERQRNHHQWKRTSPILPHLPRCAPRGVGAGGRIVTQSTGAGTTQTHAHSSQEGHEPWQA
jgi:hypothetical protein